MEENEEIEITIRITDKNLLSQFFLLIDAGVRTHGIKVVEAAAEINKQIRDQVKAPEEKNEPG